MADAIFLKKLKGLPLIVRCTTDFVTYQMADELFFLTASTSENLANIRVTQDGLQISTSELGKKHEFGVLKMDFYEEMSMN